MQYKTILKAVFLSRPNRFIAYVLLNGETAVAHVKNTGRCKELLVPGCTVYLAVSDNPERKTKYDLIAAEKIRAGRAPLLVNMDSQIPNDAAAEWLPVSGLFSERAVIRREFTHGDSRVDFYVEDGQRKAFIEVKGCTLEDGGVALFPDAPTERGVKHLKHLIRAAQDGYECYVLIVIQMKDVSVFRPNEATDPAFAQALREAKEAGVKILAMDCLVQPDEMRIDSPVKTEV